MQFWSHLTTLNTGDTWLGPKYSVSRTKLIPNLLHPWHPMVYVAWHMCPEIRDMTIVCVVCTWRSCAYICNCVHAYVSIRICVCIRLYVCIIRICVCTRLYVCIDIYVCRYAHILMYEYMDMYVCIYKRMWLYTCMHVCMCLLVYTCMSVCVSVCMRVWIHALCVWMYVCIHSHTWTPWEWQSMTKVASPIS